MTGEGKHPAVAILEDLVRIQSVNPFYGAEAQGEMELSRYIEARCRKAGLQITRQEVFPGRDNLIAELKTGHPESVLLLEAHMDTVSLGTMERPLEPVTRGGRLYGRGACDTKAALAGMIFAMEQCARDPRRLRSDLVLCASVDEEYAFRGVMKMLEWERPVHAAVVGEPTELRIVTSHKGCVRFEVETIGKAAHSSVPHEGQSAIVAMASVIHYLTQVVARRLEEANGDPLCGQPTLSIGTIHGGKQVNIVPESCVISVDRRIVPGENPETVMKELAGDIQTWCRSQGITCRIRPLLLDWALHTPSDSRLAQVAGQAAAALQLPHVCHGETYGSNASKLQGIGGIPSIVYGPGSIAQAHSREEWVELEQVVRAAAFYEELARSFRNG